MLSRRRRHGISNQDRKAIARRYSTIAGRKEIPVSKVKRSTGNVFKDLGFPAEEAEYLKIRSTLMGHLRRIIKERGLSQAAAAKLFGVTQPRVSDLVRGRIDLFSIDTLVDLLSRAGVKVRLALAVTASQPRWPGKTQACPCSRSVAPRSSPATST